MELAERHGQKIDSYEKSINERAIKNFLRRRDHQGHSRNMRNNVEPSQGGALTELLVRVRAGIELAQARVEPVQPNPGGENADADDDGFPTDFPAHLLDQRADLPNHPCGQQRLDNINPIARFGTELALEWGQHGVNCEG